MTQFECRPITDEDLRLLIGYSARSLLGGGIGFVATHDRKRCWSDHSAPTPEDLVAKLDAEVVPTTTSELAAANSRPRLSSTRIGQLCLIAKAIAAFSPSFLIPAKLPGK